MFKIAQYGKNIWHEMAFWFSQTSKKRIPIGIFFHNRQKNIYQFIHIATLKVDFDVPEFSTRKRE